MPKNNLKSATFQAYFLKMSTSENFQLNQFFYFRFFQKIS